jgi:uncharacterized membrane protein YjjP (DUF1212 family)
MQTPRRKRERNKNKMSENQKITIGINMPNSMAKELEKRAKSIHISKSQYCKLVFQQWIDSGKKLVLTEEK